jgi:rhamnosyltransferase
MSAGESGSTPFKQEPPENPTHARVPAWKSGASSVDSVPESTMSPSPQNPTHGRGRIDPAQIFAVTVTFNPTLEDGRLGSQIAEVSRRVGIHVIVDNGSENLSEIKKVAERSTIAPSRLLFVALTRNEGIARALNAGVAKCREVGAPTWILTLDQDTTFTESSFPLLEQELSQIDGFDQVGILAFNYVEHRFNSRRPYNHFDGPARMASIITSGNLVRTAVFDRIQFDDPLFLYFVDVDFCRKVRALGYSIVVLRTAFIDHEEGRRHERDGQVKYYLDPVRLFYVSRNGLVMLGRYRKPQDPVIAAYLVFMNLVAGARPFESLRAAFRGAMAVPAFLKGER